jgi:hypothetical protein
MTMFTMTKPCNNEYHVRDCAIFRYPAILDSELLGIIYAKISGRCSCETFTVMRLQGLHLSRPSAAHRSADYFSNFSKMSTV